MSRRTSAWLIAAVVLAWGCQSVAAVPASPYEPVAGPWRPVAVSEPGPAPSVAPGPSYEPVAHPAVPRRVVAQTAGRSPASTPPAVRRPSASAHRLAGVATWYDYVPGGAAAGPALRAAIGPGWRGTRVTVCAGSRCVVVLLSDWCQCYGTRLVDLDRRAFAVLADPSRGVLDVTVSW